MRGNLRTISANLAGDKQSYHLRGNHSVTFDGPDAATVFSHGYAWNRMQSGAEPDNGSNPMWEVRGTYEHGFARTEDGWEVTSMPFNATAERSNDYVRNTPGS